ncbi:MAG: hypothetical protein NC178_03095 [Bacteroides sp.]|nr:hypothetical protein [Bacteroides sp.]
MTQPYHTNPGTTQRSLSGLPFSSIPSSRRFISTPAENPPNPPSDDTTLWHGIANNTPFAPKAPATHLAPPGIPTRRANSP